MAEMRSHDKEMEEINQNPFNRLPVAVLLMIFDKLIVTCSSTQTSLKSLCWCSMVSKKFRSLFFQTPVKCITLYLPAVHSSDNTSPLKHSMYNFLSKFNSIETLYFQLSYPVNINNHINDRFSSPIIQWTANVRLLRCCFIFLFAKGSGTGLLPLQWETNWCLQVSIQKFQTLFSGFLSLWSVVHNNKNIMARRVVVTDPQTPNGSIVFDRHIDEMKNVSPKDAGNGRVEMSAKCWMAMSDQMGVKDGDKLVIVRNDDSSEDFEAIVRKAFEGQEDEDLVSRLVKMVKLKPICAV